MWTKFHGSPSNSCLSQKCQPAGVEEKSEDHQNQDSSSGEHECLQKSVWTKEVDLTNYDILGAMSLARWKTEMLRTVLSSNFSEYICNLSLFLQSVQLIYKPRISSFSCAALMGLICFNVNANKQVISSSALGKSRLSFVRQGEWTVWRTGVLAATEALEFRRQLIGLDRI